jgi:outer membrane protein
MISLKKLSVTLTLILASASFSAQAADKTDNKIAVVDIQKVVKNSLASKDISSQIEKKRAAYQAAVTKQEDELRKKDQELSKQQSILSPEAFQQKAKEFKSRVADVQKDVQSRRVKLEKGYEQAIMEVQKVVLDIVAKLADEKGFVIAIPTSQILYAKPDMDISTEVLERLNARLSNVPVKIDEAPAAVKK